jgi:transcriptional regulator with XRE-family HTH domain
MSLEKSIFSQNLVKARKLKGLKQREAATAIFKSLKTYQKYEEGRAEPDHETLLKICEVFSVDDLQLFLSSLNYFLLKKVG